MYVYVCLFNMQYLEHKERRERKHKEQLEAALQDVVMPEDVLVQRVVDDVHDHVVAVYTAASSASKIREANEHDFVHNGNSNSSSDESKLTTPMSSRSLDTQVFTVITTSTSAAAICRDLLPSADEWPHGHKDNRLLDRQDNKDVKNHVANGIDLLEGDSSEGGIWKQDGLRSRSLTRFEDLTT